MVVDVAHIVATHHLATGEPALAAAAGQVALRAGSSQDVPLLDLVAACDAQDNILLSDALERLVLPWLDQLGEHIHLWHDTTAAGARLGIKTGSL